MIIEKIDELITRLSQLFQVQTHEVITALNQIRDLIETPAVEVWDVILESNAPSINKEDVITVKTKEDLVKEYIEKFGKKPFAWWDKEVLQSKLN